MSARVPPPTLRNRPARRAPSARRPRAGRALAAPLLLALVLVAALGAGATPAPAVAQQPPGTPTPTPGGPTPTPIPGGPPANDPAGPPSAYTLARSDQLFVAKTQPWPDVPGDRAFGSTYTVKPDLSGLSGSTPYADTGLPAGDPSWPLLPVRGRFSDPLHEQALLLSQSNDCSPGLGRCRYTFLLEQPYQSPSSVTPWLRLVQGDPGGSPVAVAAGDLDGRMSAQGFPNDEAVVAYRGPDGALQVAVIDYNAAPGEAVETAPTVALPATGTAAAGPGSLGVGVGDFDNDGQNEIAVLWQGEGCRIAGPACSTVPHLSMLRYTNTGQSRSVAVLRADVPLPAALLTGSPAPEMGFQVAVDDFDGQGQDQLAFSFIAQDAGLAVLGFTPLDEQFTVARFGRDPGDWGLSAYCPQNACTPEAAGAVPQLAAGLFWYDEQSGHGLGRRQLALTALLQVDEQGYGVGLQVYDVAFDPTTCTSSLPCPLTLSGLFDAKQVGAAQPWPLSGSAGGPYCCVPPTFSLAAGSFQGLVLNPKDASQIPWALAVGTAVGQAPPAANAPAITYYRLSGSQAGQFTLDTLFQTDVAGPSGDAAAFRLLAYDPAGASLVLGAPLVFTMTGHYVPTWILQDPPKHLDWFYDPQQKHGSWLNVDRSDSLNLTLTDATTSTYSSQNDTTTSWTIGASVTVNVTASASEGLDKVAELGQGLDASATVGGQYDHNHDWYAQSGSSDTLSVSGATNDDDLLAGTERTWSVYRYPIVNYTLKDTDGDPLRGRAGSPSTASTS